MGMRNFTQYLEDLADLYKNTKEQAPDINDRLDDLGDVQITVTPDQAAKTLLFLAKVRGSGSDIYDTKIMFNNVAFRQLPADGQMQLGNFMITGTGGRKYYFGLLGYRGNHVQVSCTCPHFTQRLAVVHKQTGSLLEKKDYSKPQACKHIFKVAQALKERGVLVASSETQMLFNQVPNLGPYGDGGGI